MVFVTGDTMVLMADGLERRIDELRVGDMVHTDHGPMRVQDVMIGYEAEIAEIVFADGKVLQVTSDQNLPTDREVQSIVIKQFGDSVYGVMLDQDAELIYNGVRLNNQRGY